MAGRTVEIPGKVNRVATSFPATNQIIFMLGAGDKLVGTVEGIQNRAWFVKIYPEIAELPRPFNSDGTVNTETLLGLDPDVVILTTGSDAMATKIEELGIPVLMFGFSDPDTLKKGVELIGTVLGKKELEKANQWVDYYDGNIERVTSATSSIPAEQRPGVYYCASGPLNTEGEGTLVQCWMEIGGGVNVAAEGGVVGSFKDVWKAC
jgi:iron complex transport system substrate-binding protein